MKTIPSCKLPVMSTAVLAVFINSACGQTPAAASSASLSSLSSSQIYTAVGNLSGARRAAAIDATGDLSFSKYYELLLSTSTDAAFTIDGVQLSHVRTMLESAHDGYMSLDANYSNVRAYWTAVGSNPSLNVSEAAFSKAIQTATQMLGAGKSASSHLSLTLGTGTGDCNTYEFNKNLPKVGTNIQQAYHVAADPNEFAAGSGVLPLDGTPLYYSPVPMTEEQTQAAEFIRNGYNIVANVAPVTNPKTGAQVYLGATKYRAFTVSSGSDGTTTFHSYASDNSTGCKVQLASDGTITSATEVPARNPR